jgi:hypothetical protein
MLRSDGRVLQREQYPRVRDRVSWFVRIRIEIRLDGYFLRVKSGISM